MGTRIILTAGERSVGAVVDRVLGRRGAPAPADVRTAAVERLREANPHLRGVRTLRKGTPIALPSTGPFAKAAPADAFSLTVPLAALFAQLQGAVEGLREGVDRTITADVADARDGLTYLKSPDFKVVVKNSPEALSAVERTAKGLEQRMASARASGAAQMRALAAIGERLAEAAKRVG